MPQIVRKDEGILRHVTDNYSVLNKITRAFSPQVSLAVAKAQDFCEQVITDYDRIYYVIEGNLTLKFAKEEVILNQGDSIFLSKGTDYVMSGTFKAVIVNSPAFGA